MMKRETTNQGTYRLSQWTAPLPQAWQQWAPHLGQPASVLDIRLSKQVLIKLKLQQTKLDYEGRYKIAFKIATNLVTSSTGEPVTKICNRFNVEYSLDGSKRLARSTVYQATEDGRAGCSPTGKKGLEFKIPIKLMEMVTMHAAVCQIGDGELKGKDLKRLIGASMLGTPHADRYKPESVWRKACREFPNTLQAATNIAIEDARVQWTAYDNTNQWFRQCQEGHTGNWSCWGWTGLWRG